MERAELKRQPHAVPTVLLVDDEEIIREVGARMLEALGYQVVTAINGKDALQAFQRRRADIDIVLLDLIMPHLGGEETFMRLKALDPAVKVILCTGDIFGGPARRIMQQGCTGFIQKPFTLDELGAKLNEVISEA